MSCQVESQKETKNNGLVVKKREVANGRAWILKKKDTYSGGLVNESMRAWEERGGESKGTDVSYL